MVISTANLLEIINVMEVDPCGILSRSVGQTNRKKKYGGHSEYIMQKSTTTGQVGLPIQRWAFQHETLERVIALKSAPVYAQRLHTN